MRHNLKLAKGGHGRSLFSFLIRRNEAEDSRMKWQCIYLCCHFACILYSMYRICTCPMCKRFVASRILHTLLKESVDWKIDTLIWFRCMKKSLIEDKRDNEAQRLHTNQNPKRHILMVNFEFLKIQYPAT